MSGQPMPSQPSTQPRDELFSAEETARRRDEALRRALNTPPHSRRKSAERPEIPNPEADAVTPSPALPPWRFRFVIEPLYRLLHPWELQTCRESRSQPQGVSESCQQTDRP